jgi:hypothetical protein
MFQQLLFFKILWFSWIINDYVSLEKVTSTYVKWFICLCRIDDIKTK